MLLQPSAIVGGVHVGVVDDTASPVSTTFVVPACVSHDFIKTLAEAFQRFAVVDGFIYRFTKGEQHFIAVGSCHHKEVVVFIA